VSCCYIRDAELCDDNAAAGIVSWRPSTIPALRVRTTARPKPVEMATRRLDATVGSEARARRLGLESSICDGRLANRDCETRPGTHRRRSSHAQPRGGRGAPDGRWL